MSSNDNYINYIVINNLSRCLKNGVQLQKIVDNTIDNFSQLINIRNSIEQFRRQSEQLIKNENNDLMTRSLFSLQRYYLLICFAAYLYESKECHSVYSKETFSSWFMKHLELVNMYKDLNIKSIVNTTTKSSSVDNMNKHSVIESRKGQVLSANMILKFDHFPGCQKAGLECLIEGAPNFRRVELNSINGNVFGVAMPTKKAINSIIEYIKMKFSNNNNNNNNNNIKIIWTCLREEPVLFVQGNPYVLRSEQDPFRNLETTGIDSSRVERMEIQMKKDVMDELVRYNGKLLLHEEEAEASGKKFSIVPVWESVDSVETLKQVYSDFEEIASVQLEYVRLPVTDEQSPIPMVFDLLLEQVDQFSSNTFGIFNCQMG